ncbi:MAG: hypothetical protein ACREWG_04315 [Gammaproteobacteria bacterium]
MTIVPLKATAAIALCMSATAYSGIAVSHDVSGSLGKKSSATDVYQVTCSDEEGGATPSYRLMTKVRDNKPNRPPRVSVWTIKDGTTTKTTDTNGDGNARYSATAVNNNGNGVYVMKVTKSRRDAENYSVQFHCEGPPSSGYIHTGTDLIRTQNQ